jgi:ribosome-binding protein aMBF1 (putative translation factor)
MLVLPASSVRFCRICGRMCQLHDSKIDEQGLTVHTDCQANRMASIRSDAARQATAVRRNRPVTEYLHGFAVRDL